MSNLVLFGPYNMNAQKCAVHKTTERSLPTQMLQREKVARQHGTVLVSQNYNEKMISMEGRVKKPAGHVPTFREIENEFDNSMSKTQRTLRISRRWTNLADASISTNWAAADDAANVTTNTSTYQVSSAALSFDLDVSGSAEDYATVSNASLTAVDLSAVEDTGNIEFWIYIPNNTNITSLDFRWGSDASNYWEQTGITTNYEGKLLENGWNYVSIYWPTATQVLSPSASAVDYLFVRLNYTSSQQDMTGILLNGFRWVDEDQTVNYTAIVESVNKEEGHYHKDFQPFAVNFLCTAGMALATQSETAETRDSVSSATKTMNVTFYGSYDPEPTIVYTLATSTGLDTLTYYNKTTNESMTIDTVFTAGSTIVLDTGLLKATIDGSDVSYTGVFPRHVVGTNTITTSVTTTGTETLSSTLYDDEDWEILGTRYKFAQSFTTGSAGTAGSLQLYCRTLDNGIGTGGTNSFYVKIYTNSAGNPGSVIASGTIYPDLSGQMAWKDVSLTTSPSLSAAALYWIVATNPVNGKYSLVWAFNSTSSYADGMAKYADGSTWYDGIRNNSATADRTFSIEVSPTSLFNYDFDITYKRRFL